MTKVSTPSDRATPQAKPDLAWRELWRFVKRSTFSTIGFAIIGAAALLLEALLRFALRWFDVDPVLLVGLKGVEYYVFVIDLELFARFIWREAQVVRRRFNAPPD